MSIEALTKKYRDGDLSPVDVVKMELKKLRLINKRINPIAHMFDEEGIVKKAKASAKRYKENKVTIRYII